jgi:hypothetical protein
MRQLVLVHGRSQQNKDAKALKAEWLEALKEGLSKSGLKLPIAESDVRFPYYGDTLDQMVDGKSAEAAAQVIVRGNDMDQDQKRFRAAVLVEIAKHAGLTEAQIAEAAGDEDVIRRGVLNWGWVHAILKALDNYVPLASGTSIALFTYDVYQYLKNSTIRKQIDAGVSSAIPSKVESVVVSHSLGTVVAYNCLVQRGRDVGWKVPLFVTLGCPLGIDEIKTTMKLLAPLRCPECVTAWFNAFDPRDVVALYPLSKDTFPLDPDIPSIENKIDVSNKTENRHGIAGYLDDKDVAKRIHDALIAK